MVTLLAVDVAAWPFPFGWAYSNLLANLLASAIWAIPTAVVLYRKLTCSMPRCPRFRHLSVAGTTYASCRHHATPEHHAMLVARHADRHPHTHRMIELQASGVAPGQTPLSPT